MRIEDFDYDLPPEFIAQRPVRPRDRSRLLILDRSTGQLDHLRFYHLPDLLSPKDLLVVNETRVLPVRLNAKKQPGGGRAELLLLNRQAARTWEALVGGSGLTVGRLLQLDGGLEAEILQDLGQGKRLVRFSEPVENLLSELGEVPLPPYIHASLQDAEDYQTIFARFPGSAAAPTAGFHFTEDLLRRIRERGVQLGTVTLHIGLDTFAPVRESDPALHPIHSEQCEVSADTIQLLKRTKESHGRVVAVGTSVVRALETLGRGSYPGIQPYQGATDLYILPGFEFRIVDAMITNFHLPRSTLLMLVSAFAGRERILAAYESAKARGYRFYSFGDAMFIR